MSDGNGWLVVLGLGLGAVAGGYVGYKLAKADNARHELEAVQRETWTEAGIVAQSQRLGHLEVDARFLRVTGQAVTERLARLEGYLIPPEGLSPTDSGM